MEPLKLVDEVMMAIAEHAEKRGDKVGIKTAH